MIEGVGSDPLTVGDTSPNLVIGVEGEHRLLPERLCDPLVMIVKEMISVISYER